MNNLLTIRNNSLKTTSNASVLVETLYSLGTDCIFGYPGAAVLSIYNELAKFEKIKHYLVRHEQAALHAAEGYARVSGKTGVVLVTSGPGFTNTITGIANAYADHTPLIVLAGDVSASGQNGKVFQKVDIVSLTKSCAKKTFMVSAKDDIKKILQEAHKIASSDVKGPVVIALPRNVLEAQYRPLFKRERTEYVKKQDYSKAIQSLKILIEKSKRPLLIVGGGAINASSEIQKFALKVNCPVVSTLMGIGIYPSSDENYLGMIGINGGYLANSALNQSDLLISIGMAFSDRSTCKNLNFTKKTKIVSINIEDIPFDIELKINADAKYFLRQFLSKISDFAQKSEWHNIVDILRAENIKPESKSELIHSSFVLETLSNLTKEYEPVVVTDVGQHQMLTAQYFNFDKPRKFITSGGMGTMGFGLPASIGAHIANPKTIVLNITGDGSFQMNLQELATCREHNIPVKIIIMNNSSLGMVRQLQEKIYNTQYQVHMINPDFAKIAEAYDLFAISVSDKKELVPALKNALEYNGTAIIDIKIDPEENI